MPSAVLIVGSGNVATAFARSLSPAGIEIGIYSRNPVSGTKLSAPLNIPYYRPGEVPAGKYSLAIIATQDAQIPDAAASLENLVSRMVHTSGTVPTAVLQPFAQEFGVLYPLQTLRREIPSDWKEIPLCIHTSSNELKKELQHLSSLLGASFYDVDDLRRQHLHLGAVTVNNFTHHLAVKVRDYLEQQGIDFAILHPLIRKTAEITTLPGPIDVLQTGPAVRGDVATMQKHLDMLLESGDNGLADLYAAMSESIQCYLKK